MSNEGDAAGRATTTAGGDGPRLPVAALASTGDRNAVGTTVADASHPKTAEAHAKAARRFAENILDTVREPLMVLDAELRVRSANIAFYKAFATRPEEVQGRFIFDLDEQGWDIAKLHELLERVILDKTAVEDFEVAHEFPRLGRRVLLLNARWIESADGSDDVCLLAIEDITQRKAAEEALSKRNAYLAAVLATVPDGVITIDERGIIASFSPAAERLFGFAAAEVVGKSIGLLMPQRQRGEHLSHLTRQLRAVEAEVIGRESEVTGQKKDGTWIPLRLLVTELHGTNHRSFVCILHDLTKEKKRLEQLQQTHKMEALGQLAGGIAHDFNNLLTIIIGNNELLQADLPEDHRKFLARATGAAELGASLTRRLLSFGHRQEFEPVVLCVNDHVHGMMELLRRTIPETITVMPDLTPDLWQSRINPVELENTLLNLVVNARDAMPKGGKVTIETANATIGPDRAAALAELAPGDYVRLSVVDTGAGMPPEVLNRATEPFFTTKPAGKGTGLGLATAHGFAKQSGGLLTIASAVDKGTTISLYLPRATGEQAPMSSAPGGVDIPFGNGELILVVDDDDQVREITLKRLESLGYAVIEASNGPQAVERCRSDEPIALAMIDIVMPGGMTGYEVADILRKRRPDIKVLLTTGSGSDVREDHPGIAGRFAMLEKPYTRAVMAHAVAKALAG